MHVPAIWRNPLNRNDKDHYQWLKANDAIPVYMQEVYPDVPMSRKYPLDDIVAKLLPGFTRPPNEVWDDHGMYATSSLAMALALGIYQGYKRIELWGIGLAMNTEYVYQRPGAMFWIGYALGHGIEVELKGQMFDAPLYGYNGDIYIDLGIFEKRVADLNKLLPKVEQTYNQKRIAVLDVLSAYKDNRVTAELVKAAQLERVQSLVDLAQVVGVIFENQTYIDKAHEMMQSSGENDFRFSRSEFEHKRNALRKACAVLTQDRASQRIMVEQAFNVIDKAAGYKKRCRAIDQFAAAYDADLEMVRKLASMDAQSTENIRYLNILDEQYRAAGGQKSVEVLSGMQTAEE